MSWNEDNKWLKIAVVAGGALAVAAVAVLLKKKSAEKAKAQKAAKKQAKKAAKAAAAAAQADTQSRSVTTPAPAAAADDEPVYSAPATTSTKTKASTTAATATATAAVAATAAAPPGSDELTLAQIMSFFSDILQGMNGVIVDLSRHEQQLMSQGQDEMKVKEEISQIYLQAITQLQMQCFVNHGLTESQIEKATVKYAHDERFQAITMQIQKLNLALLGEQPGLNEEQLQRVPEWLTVDKLIEIFTEMIDGINAGYEDSLATVRAKHPTGFLPEDEVQEQNIIFGRKAREEILAKHGIDEETFNIGLFKHANEPKLRDVMLDLQESHQARRQELLAKELEQNSS